MLDFFYTYIYNYNEFFSFLASNFHIKENTQNCGIKKSSF